jgi:hypothetical protein
MDDILQDLSPSALVTASEENMFTFFRSSTQAKVHDDPELLWWITDSPFPFFNMAFRANLTPETANTTVEAVIARARARQVSLLWWTGPATRPSTLGLTLEAHGFVPGKVLGMAVDLQTLQDARPVSGLVIERVRDEETLRQWCHVFVSGYGMPSESADGWLAAYAGMDFAAHYPLRHYLGSVAGVPVATSSLCLAEGVAGIYCVAILPPFRQRGIGAAMTLAPLREAQGYRAGILQASELGVPVYARLGFREYCTLGIYVWNNHSEGVKQEDETESR